MSHFEKRVPLKSISSKWTIFEVIYFELTNNLKPLSSKWPFFEVSYLSKWPILRSDWFLTYRFTEVNFFLFEMTVRLLIGSSFWRTKMKVWFLRLTWVQRTRSLFSWKIIFVSIWHELYLLRFLRFWVNLFVSKTGSIFVITNLKVTLRWNYSARNWIWNRFWTLEILDFLSVLCNNFGPDDKTFDLTEKWRICDLIETEFITYCES